MISVGLDLGRRVDASALAITDLAPPQARLVGISSLPAAPYREQVEMALPALRRADVVVVDAGGVGDGVLELIPARIRVLPIVIVAGHSGPKPIGDRWSVGKAYLISLLATGRLLVPPETPGRFELLEEMRAFMAVPKSRGRVKLQARTGAHDDLVLATALSLLPLV